MASSSSDESCKAPENFQVSSTSNEDDDDDNDFCEGKITSLRQSRVQLRKATTFTKHKRSLGNSESNLLRCPLCCNKRERFHCRSCVKNGNITKSQQSQQQQCDSESLSEKQQKFMQTQAKIKALSSKYEQIIQKTKASENINFEVKRKQEQLTLISSLIDNKLKRISSLKEKNAELRKANADKRKTLPAYERKVKALEQYVLDRVEKIESLREKHKTILEQLKQTSRNGIQQLVEYIFPIKEIVLKDELQQRRENCKTEDLETIAALAEAKNTSYIRGKWVFHGSGISEVQYRIVAASLPANGDYSAYLDWLTDNKDDVPKSTAIEILPSRVMAFRIMGALTYTTQLTQLISYFLNVRLPHKLAYGDFCRKLNEEQFMRKVSRLNSNIMYLAYTQHVQLRPLNENHTLENLLTILDVEKSDLGRQGCHEVGNAPLMRSVDSLLFGIETATESESEDENSLRLDWESVPPSLAVTPSDALAANTGLPLNQQSRIAEGLVTSAANRLTSMLRWMK